MWGRSAVLLWGALALSQGCDLQSRKSKLPKTPKPAAAPTPTASPVDWATSGDAACPAISVAHAEGAPGNTVREGILTREPASGTVACQIDGRNHGPATDFDERRGSASGNYQFGQRHGPWTGRHADGTIAWRGTFESGEQTGDWTYWDEAGGLVATGQLVSGRRIGMWTFWDSVESAGPSRFEAYDKVGQRERDGVFVGGKPVVSHALCAIGRPYPMCRAVLSASMGYRRGPSGRTDGGNENSMSIESDLTINVVGNHGVGASATIYVGDEFARYAVRGAYRYYLADGLAAELAGGLLFARGGLGPRAGESGQTARLELNLFDQLAAGVELSRYALDGDSNSALVAVATVRVGWIPLVTAAFVAAKIGGR